MTAEMDAEALAELQRLAGEYEQAEVGSEPDVNVTSLLDALPALLDAAEERDTLRAERDALAEAVERVRALHVEEHVYIGPSDPIGGFICRACGEPVESEPCPTVRALDGEADR